MPATGVQPSNAEVTTEVDRAVEILRRVTGVRRVWFFGSRANRTGHPDSDLDFAVEGLPSEAHFAVLGDLMLTLRAPLDLVRWEEAGDALRAEIIRRGTVVYAA
jgi:predicted nucleotidyltransferase